MNAAVERVNLGPINGTLNDADVKALIVRAARASTAAEVHGIIKLFARNRLALVQVINGFRKGLSGSAKTISATSSFDIALLEQLKVTRDELESTKAKNGSLVAQNIEFSSLLSIADRHRDVAQRLAERTRRELRMASKDRERLVQSNETLATELERNTAALKTVSERHVMTLERIERLEREYEATMALCTEACSERDTLRTMLSSSSGNLETLQRQYAKQDALVKQLQETIGRHVKERAEERRNYEALKAEGMTQILELMKGLNFDQQYQPVAAPISAANVVAFSNRARMSELEIQLQQREVTLHSQAVGVESAAKILLDILPADQREIYANTSYDASLLMLIAGAVKRYKEDRIAGHPYHSGGIGHSI